MRKHHLVAAICLATLVTSWSAVAADTLAPASPDQRNAYYGDLHLHTAYSFDAYVLAGTKVDPNTAYLFAKGEKVNYLGQTVQRREPLDFMAVTDHSENIGVFNQLEDPNSVVSKSQTGMEFKD